MDAYGRPIVAASQPMQYGSSSQPMPGMQATPIQGMPPAAPATQPTAYPSTAGAYPQYPQGVGAVPAPQYPQQQVPQVPSQAQQQPVQQPAQAGQAAPPAGEQPGFFRRLFGKGGEATDGTVIVSSAGAEEDSLLSRLCSPGKKTEPAPQHSTGQQGDEAETARCLPSKPLAAEAVAALRQRILPLSKLPFLNPANGQTPPYVAASAPNMQPTSTPGIIGPPPEVSRYGPYLRFGGYDPISRQWRGSVLILVHQARCAIPPILRFRDVHVRGAETEVHGQHLSHYQGWNFWRCNIVIECGIEQRSIEYMVVLPTDHAFTYHTRYTFVVAGIHQRWRWGFYSCNGSHDVAYEQATGIQALWKDVMFCHQQSPFHVLLGGGDQVYNDAVWQCPALEAWTGISGTEARCAHPFTQDMVNQVFNFYFCNYIRKWTQPVLADAYAAIPQMMVWDDHDIWDGWGSYPEHLQACPVFQGVYYIAREFYALFQQHTTVARAHHDNGVWGAGGWHCLTCLGASTAVLVMDTRAERTPRQVLHPASWQTIYHQLSSLPSSIRHVVVLATVPVIYPQIPVVESALQFLAGDGRSRWGILQMMQKTGLADSLISQFGTVEILDDLVDHWGAEVHADEKIGLVQMMQALSLAYGFRFTLLSGDVHCAAVGRFSSFPVGNLKTDHRYVPQIISSAIGNFPPPDGVVKALTACAKPKQILPDTRETMVNVFGVQKVVYAARNWLQVSEQPYMPGAVGADGSLHFQFHVENPDLRGARPEIYDVLVPPLELPASGRLQLPPLQHAPTYMHVPLQPVQASVTGPYPAQYQMPNGTGVASPVAQQVPGAQQAQQAPAGPANGSYPMVPAAHAGVSSPSPIPSTPPPAVGQTTQPAYPLGPAQQGAGLPGNSAQLPPAPYPGGRPASPAPGSPAWLLNQSATPGTFMPQPAPVNSTTNMSSVPPGPSLSGVAGGAYNPAGVMPSQSSYPGVGGGAFNPAGALPSQSSYPAVLPSGQQQYNASAATQQLPATASYPPQLNASGGLTQPSAPVPQLQQNVQQQQQAAPALGPGQYSPAGVLQQNYPTPGIQQQHYATPGTGGPPGQAVTTGMAAPAVQQTGAALSPPYTQAAVQPYAPLPQQQYGQQPAVQPYAPPPQQQYGQQYAQMPVPGQQGQVQGYVNAPGTPAPVMPQAPMQAPAPYPGQLYPAMQPVLPQR